MPTKGNGSDHRTSKITIEISDMNLERMTRLAVEDGISLEDWCRMALCCTAAALSWRPVVKVNEKGKRI